ncbi:MAG: DUF3990 domain-containing protein [Bacteroidaceae bacterium]|nr:DUF3990 domain-containing protein [Bacteroidaceae bacterium]
MRIYHGSTNVIEHPIVAAGRLRLDFGKGFYVTDIKTQAELWAKRMQRIRQEAGVVNVYEMDMERVKTSFRYFRFLHYDNEWLQFIVANRMGRTDIEQYDVIEGGVANDRVIDTVEAYMANLMTLDVALRELAKHQPNNQLCITNQEVIDTCVKFVESYNIEA